MSVIGTIDCGFLAMYQGRLDAYWADPITNVDLIANAEAAKAVLENQTVKMEVLTGKKKRILSLDWLTNCNVTTTDCTDDCTITGVDANPVCVEYEIECLQETTFKMPKRQYRERTVEFEEAFAFNMASHKKALDEYLAQYIVTGLAMYAGTNQYTGGVGTVVGQNTTIPAKFWDDSVWGYFNRVARGNNFKSPYMITGDNLFQYIFNRRNEMMTEAGKAAAMKMGTINKIYVDPENVEAIAPGTTFLINKSAVAFINKAWNPLGPVNAIAEAGIYTLWSEQSINIPGIYYDIIAQETCENNEFYTAVKLQLHGLFAANPSPCNDANTGLLKFTCV